MKNDEKQIQNQSANDNESPQVRNDGIATKKPIPLETSRRITSLRFLLIVLVVFIHNNFRAEELAKSVAKDLSVPLFNQSQAGVWIQRFISQGIASCAVPVFFMISAYLFFKKSDSYKTVLRKKFRALVVPYFLWIILNIALYVAIKLLAVKLNQSLVQNPDNIAVLKWRALDWIKAFFGYGFDEYNHPFAGQLWFVRDLFLMMILSPFLRVVYKNFPKTSLILAAFIYVLGIDLYVIQKETVLFFTLGYFWAEKDFDFFSFSDSFKWIELWMGFLLAFILQFTFFKGNSVCSSLQVLFASLIFLKLSKSISENEKVFAATKYLAEFSFWLFAIHMPILLSFVQNLWLHFLPMKNGFFCLAEYFCVSILVIVIGTISGIISKKIFPPLFRLLNGER